MITLRLYGVIHYCIYYIGDVLGARLGEGDVPIREIGPEINCCL